MTRLSATARYIIGLGDGVSFNVDLYNFTETNSSLNNKC